METLLAHWQNFTDQTSFIHKEDSVRQPLPFTSYDEYIHAYVEGNVRRTDIHSGLLPVPYIGHLRTAKIFILMLNPGFSHADYMAEQQSSTFTAALRKNIRQEKIEYPFLFLDPDFLWTGGGRFWEGQLGEYAQMIASTHNVSYREGLRCVAQSTACLELMPYHSQSRISDARMNALTSVQRMQQYFAENLLPRAERKEIALLVARGRKHWQRFTDHPIVEAENIVVYTNGEAVGASLRPGSRAGKMLKVWYMKMGAEFFTE